MVESDITKEMIDSGAQLVKALDTYGLQPDAAFWIYFPDLEAWKLCILEIKVDRLGPKAVYAQIQKVLTELKETSLALDSISVLKTDAPLVGLLRKAIKTGPGISGIRFQKNVINGTLIEDAYIYRMK